jgi:CHAT domain-containing protein
VVFPPLPHVPRRVKCDRAPGYEWKHREFIRVKNFSIKILPFSRYEITYPNHDFLHIATHSKFVPGRANQSFLLLGTGERLAIPDIETWLNLRNINLVVLSACETALGGKGLDGREIAGVGYYFLKGGAKTVMASLWRVDDYSTRLLMENFTII